MKIKKIKEIEYSKNKLLKLYNFKKTNFRVKEIYMLKMKDKQSRHWRQHMNCTKILFCTNGIFEVKIFYKMKIIKKILKTLDFIEIPKKTIFNFSSLSKKENNMVVLSDLENDSLITIKKFNF